MQVPASRQRYVSSPSHPLQVLAASRSRCHVKAGRISDRPGAALGFATPRRMHRVHTAPKLRLAAGFGSLRVMRDVPGGSFVRIDLAQTLRRCASCMHLAHTVRMRPAPRRLRQSTPTDDPCRCSRLSERMPIRWFAGRVGFDKAMWRPLVCHRHRACRVGRRASSRARRRRPSTRVVWWSRRRACRHQARQRRLRHSRGRALPGVALCAAGVQLFVRQGDGIFVGDLAVALLDAVDHPVRGRGCSAQLRRRPRTSSLLPPHGASPGRTDRR